MMQRPVSWSMPAPAKGALKKRPAAAEESAGPPCKKPTADNKDSESDEVDGSRDAAGSNGNEDDVGAHDTWGTHSKYYLNANKMPRGMRLFIQNKNDHKDKVQILQVLDKQVESPLDKIEEIKKRITDEYAHVVLQSPLKLDKAVAPMRMFAHNLRDGSA